MVKLEEPDKGQAWVVAIAACVINMILSGLSRMIGLLYVAVIETYGVSRQEATLPFTVRNSIRCLSGPLVGVIGQRYGIRAVTFYGGVIATAGASLCYIAPNITWLAIFWGGMHGLGFAFANTLFQVVVNQYFQKYRATASGIALSGACFGSFVFPVMIEVILGTFGLSGGFLILGGIVMHVLPPSLLLKAPPWVENPEEYARLKALKMKQESVETLDTMVDEYLPEDDFEFGIRDVTRSTSFDNCPVEDIDVATRSLRGSSENLAVYLEHTACMEKKKRRCKKNVLCTLYKISESPPAEQKNSSRAGSTVSANGRSTSLVPNISENVDVKENNLKNSLSLPEEKSEVPENENATLWESVKGIGLLYTSPVYVLISICMATYVIIFIPILTVIVDYSMDKGIPETAGKYLINSMALGDLIGRLGFGWVTDKQIISIPLFMTITLVLEGVFIALFPFANTLYSLIIVLTLYGVTAGAILVHFPLLVLKYVDLKLQSVAMGCVGFLSGIISLAIPLLIGHFRDRVGSYDGMFYLNGAISVVSGGMWLLEPVVAKCHYKNEKKKSTIQNIISEHCDSRGTVSSSKQSKPS